MGCWNETCGVSQLPILAGNKVRVFVIHSHESWRGDSGGGTCYTTDRWAPLGSPVEGTYDDYGGIENIVKNEDSKFLLEIIKERWVPVDDEKDEKIPSVEKLTLEEALHFIERERAKCKSYGKEGTLGIMFVLEEVYQAMINYNPIEAHFSRERNKEFRYRPVKEIYKIDIEDWYNKSLESFAKLKEMKKSKNKDEDAIVRMLSMQMSYDLEDDMIFSFSESGVGPGSSAGRPYKKKLKEMANKGLPFNHKKVQAACDTVVDMLMFCNAMSAARKMWIPQCGKGGQHSELDIYKKLNEATNQIMAIRDKEAEEDGCLVPDAEGYYPYMREQNAKSES